MKNIFLVISAIVLIGGGLILYLTNQADEVVLENQNIDLDAQENIEVSNDLDTAYFDEEEMVSFTKDYLRVLQRLYFINQDNSTDATTVSGLIISMQTEAMQDRNELEKLLLTTEEMQQTDIAGAKVTALVLDTSIRQLIEAHEEYINFLRSSDEYSEMSEFQYQISLFQSSTKSIYLSMGEHAQIFPVTFFELNDESETAGEWRISEDSKQEIIDEIELRFSDILDEADQQYEETQSTDITVYLVGQLLEFFSGSDRF